MKNSQLENLMNYMKQKDCVKYKSFEELLDVQHEIFEEFFYTVRPMNDEVFLIFDTESDAQSFYVHCHFNKIILNDIKVYYDLQDSRRLILKPVEDISTLIVSPESGLCILSRNLKLKFRLEYHQSFTNHELSLYMIDGKVYNVNCVLKISTIIPWLSLGTVYKIMKSASDFINLNTKIEFVKGEYIHESNFFSH